MINPFLIKADYDITIPEPDVRELELRDALDAEIMTIVVVASQASQLRTNLRAPIVCNTEKGIAKQVIINDGNLPIQYFFGRRQAAVPNEEVHYVGAHSQARSEHYARA